MVWVKGMARKFFAFFLLRKVKRIILIQRHGNIGWVKSGFHKTEIFIILWSVAEIILMNTKIYYFKNFTLTTLASLACYMWPMGSILYRPVTEIIWILPLDKIFFECTSLFTNLHFCLKTQLWKHLK